MMKFTAYCAIVALVAASVAQVALAGGDCSNHVGHDVCAWMSTCPSCNRMNFDSVQMVAIKDKRDPKGIYIEGAYFSIVGSGKANFPSGEKLVAGAWTARMYEDGRLEPQVYTLTGDLVQATTFNSDGTFNFEVNKGTFQQLTIPSPKASGVFRLQLSGSDQDHVDDFYMEVQFNVTASV